MSRLPRELRFCNGYNPGGMFPIKNWIVVTAKTNLKVYKAPPQAACSCISPRISD